MIFIILLFLFAPRPPPQHMIYVGIMSMRFLHGTPFTSFLFTIYQRFDFFFFVYRKWCFASSSSPKCFMTHHQHFIDELWWFYRFYAYAYADNSKRGVCREAILLAPLNRSHFSMRMKWKSKLRVFLWNNFIWKYLLFLR